MIIPTHPSGASKARSILGTLAALVIVVAGLKAATPLVEPLLLAALIAIAVMPLLNWLTRRGVHLAISITLVVVMIAVAGAGTGLVFARSAQDFSTQLPVYQQKLDAELVTLSAMLGERGIDMPDTGLGSLMDPGSVMSLATTLFTALGNLLANGFLVLLIVVFVLFEATQFREKLSQALPGGAGVIQHFDRITAGMNHYLALKSALSLVTGVLVGLWFWIIGVDYPVLWGLLAFLLNFVPNIGSIIAAIPPVLLALVQLGPQGAVLAASGSLAVNMVVGNAIEPRVMGSGLGLSPLVVMLSLVFWGWVLGPVGMLLSVPLTMIAKIALEANPSTRPIAILLGTVDDDTPARIAEDSAIPPPTTPLEERTHMFKVNEYFDGKVKSISIESARGPATTGAMAAGEYEFNTGKPETMVITSGAADVQLKGETTWTRYGAGGTFDVPGNSSFRIRLTGDTTYLCYFN